MTRLVSAFLVILALLFVQFGFRLVFAEPYPSISYPSFKPVYDGREYFQFNDAEAAIEFANGDSVTLSTQELHQPIPRSFAAAINRTIAEESENAASPEDLAELAEWMGRQAVSATGRTDPLSVEITFYRTRIFASEDPVREERTVVSVVAVNVLDAHTTP